MYKPALINDPYFSDIVNFFETPSFYKGISKRSNIVETEEDYLIEIAVPGLSKEDVEMNVKDSVLTISHEQDESDERFHFTSSFQKQYTLPNDVNQKGIKAKIDNGVLIATIPKDKKKIKEHFIEIE